MQQSVSLKLLPYEADNSDIVKDYIALSTGKPVADVSGFYILKKSIDTRLQ